MLLVPLLVGLTFLVVAWSARKQMLDEVVDPPWRKTELVEQPARTNPLTDAFPHLQLWIPAEDSIFEAACQDAGASGPDIVLRPAQTKRQLSDAA